MKARLQLDVTSSAIIKSEAVCAPMFLDLYYPSLGFHLGNVLGGKSVLEFEYKMSPTDSMYRSQGPQLVAPFFSQVL